MKKPTVRSLHVDALAFGGDKVEAAIEKLNRKEARQ